MTYDERLVAPLWVWASTVGLSLMAAFGLHAGREGTAAWAPYAVLPLVAVVGVALLSRGRVRVAEGVLHVPGARVPLSQLGAATALDRDGTRQVLGPLAEPRAFVVTRPWLTRSVRVRLEDPEDDTPYWLIGTRHPEALAQALASPR